MSKNLYRRASISIRKVQNREIIRTRTCLSLDLSLKTKLNAVALSTTAQLVVVSIRLRQAVAFPVSLKGNQSWDAIDIKMAQHFWMVIGVDAPDFYLPAIFFLHTVQNRFNSLAGTTPRRPEIHHDWL